MSIPEHSLSTTPVIDEFLPPDDKNRTLLVDYETGGVALYDTSLGSKFQNWKMTYDGSDVVATPDNAGPTSLFTMVGITECSLTFDQNMNPFVAYVVGGLSWIWWYDSEIATQVHTQLPVGAYRPRCALDDKREIESDASDVILAYMMGNSLYTREQRERFGVVANVMTTPDAAEYLMDSNIPETWDFYRIGMGYGNRLLFSWQEVYSGSDQDPEEVARVLQLLDDAFTTGWLDLSQLPNTTFLDAFGSEVWAEDFTRVIQVGQAIAVNSPTDDVRMFIIHAPIDASEVIMLICDVNGNVSGGNHYIGYQLPSTVYIPIQKGQDKFLCIASDTGNARIRKQDFTIQEGYPYNLYMYSNPIIKISATADLE